MSYTYKEAIDKLWQLEKQAVEGGGEKEQERLRKAGKLTCRGRIEKLLDPGTFFELNMLATHQCYDFGMEKKRFYGDGVATGFGEIDGRLVFVYSQDPTVMGGSFGAVHGMKINYIIKRARETGAPVIGFYDSVGARIQEGIENAKGVTRMFFENAVTSGVVPQIAAIFGTCAGAAVYSPALMDFIFTVENQTKMFITGPPVIKAMMGEEVSPEELGGVAVHSRISGVTAFTGKNEEACIRNIRQLLSYLPANYREHPPFIETDDDPSRIGEGLETIVPEDNRKVYDMHRVIEKIVDNGEMMEPFPNFARNLIICFARIGGYAVGFIANNPSFLAGSLDVDSSDKGARFIRFCDCFNIPLVSLVDQPGFLPGRDQEYKGIIRHGAKMLYAWAEASVPKITVLIRKAYGGGTPAMCPQEIGADHVLAWPMAEYAVMGAEGAASTIFRKEIESSQNPEETRKEKIKEYNELFSNPFYGAGKMMIHNVIEPRKTRKCLFASLMMLRNKKEEKPAKKHGNIPL